MHRVIRRFVRIETVAVLVTALLAGALGLGLATAAGAVPTVALMALGLLLDGLLLLIRHNLDLASGSGASTLWLALAMRRFGIDGRIIALDHDPVFGGTTRDFLARHDVRDLAEVRDAPLESFGLGGETYSWYARRAWQDLTGIDLLFVDGPPTTTGHQARYPALPLLNGSLSPVATVVLDNLVLPDMQEVLRLWLDGYPEFGSEILPLEKQAAVLRRS